MNVVEAAGLNKTFVVSGAAPYAALVDIDLRVAPGERVAIVGPSGSGKSTLLHCLCGFEGASSGSVRLFDEEISKRSKTWLAKQYRETVGFVFQQYNLVSSLSAYENVVLPLRLGRRRFTKSEIAELFERVGLHDRMSAMPSRMSGGEQQRTAVIRAMAVAPRVIFADEPTGALDTATGAQVMTALEELASRGTSLIYVTHDPALASRADRTLVLRDGRLRRELRRPTAAEVLREMDKQENTA